MNAKPILFGLLLLALWAGVVAASGTTNITNALNKLCNDVVSVLGVVALMLILLAAVVYGAGQVMGAETRARASVWATSMIVGAVISLVIYLLLPHVIAALMGTNITCGSTTGTAGS